MEQNHSPQTLTQSATPLYQQLANELKKGMESGRYPQGSKLPTEHSLSDIYHVSRVTVRKALALLAENELIERKTGNGTYVKERKLKRNLSGNVRSFTLMCEQMGTKASARTIRITYETASASLQSKMQLKSNSQVLVIERIRYSDQSPVMIERDYFTEDFDFLFEEDLNHSSIYQLILQKKGIAFTHADRSIDIVFATASEAKILGLKNGYPLLRIMSLTQNEEGTVSTYSEQLCIGDKFKLQV